jgi:hypothetical protein
LENLARSALLHEEEADGAPGSIVRAGVSRTAGSIVIYRHGLVFRIEPSTRPAPGVL